MLRRIGEMIKIRPEGLEEYKRYHANPLPDRKEGEFWAGMEEIYHLD